MTENFLSSEEHLRTPILQVDPSLFLFLFQHFENLANDALLMLVSMKIPREILHFLYVTDFQAKHQII